MSTLRHRLSMLVLIVMVVITLMPAISQADEPPPDQIPATKVSNQSEFDMPNGTIWFRGGG